MSFPLVMMMKPYEEQILDLIYYWNKFVFNESSSWIMSITKIADNKVFIFINKDWWTWIVASISWNNITYWTPALFNTWKLIKSWLLSSCKLEDNKIFFSYYWYTSTFWDWWYYSKIATVDWMNITYWNQYTIETWYNNYNSISVVKVDTDKVVISYQKYSNYSRVATINWTAISHSWAYILPWTVWQMGWYISSELVETNKIIIVHKDNSSWKSVVATISWTNISYWSNYSYFSDQYYSFLKNKIIKIWTNKFLIMWAWWDSTWYYRCRVANLSWTVVLYWSTYNINNNANAYNWDFDLSYIEDNKVLILYRDIWDNNKWVWIVASISWNVVSFSDKFVFNNSIRANNIVITKEQTNINKWFIWYSDTWNSNYWTWIIWNYNLIIN